MTKHEEFNRLMKLCRVETVFIASVTDTIKLKYTKLPSRKGFTEYAILQTEGRSPIVVWPEHWNEVKGMIVVSTPMLFFVTEPTINGRQQKPDWKNGVVTYPPMFQWVLDDVQHVSVIDDWIESAIKAVGVTENKGE